MECTLERGFSLNESAIARDLRHERYGEVAVKYRPDKSLRRYSSSAKHFIPVRKSSRWAFIDFFFALKETAPGQKEIKKTKKSAKLLSYVTYVTYVRE